MKVNNTMVIGFGVMALLIALALGMGSTVSAHSNQGQIMGDNQARDMPMASIMTTEDYNKFHQEMEKLMEKYNIDHEIMHNVMHGTNSNSIGMDSMMNGMMGRMSMRGM